MMLRAKESPYLLPVARRPARHLSLSILIVYELLFPTYVFADDDASR